MALATGALALAAVACTETTDGPTAIQVRRSRYATSADTPVVLSGVRLAYLADEATTGASGTDLNGDGDTTDSVAVVIQMGTQVETNLGVAARGLAWLGSHLYMDVDESLDGRDWNGDSDTDDRVLLHVYAANPAAAPTFVDELSPTGAVSMLEAGSSLYYSSVRTSSAPGESNLFAISASAPLTPVRVATRDLQEGLAPTILEQDEGLLFLALDETLEGRDLNGDGDATDARVLALLDGTSGAGRIRSTELAIAASSPLRARKRGDHDWDVGFLVSEADQGRTNLNDPALFQAAWTPIQCTGAADTDVRDSILHFLRFSTWNADPVQHPPVNTGLVGCRKIAIANGYVATISPESGTGDSNGAEGTCDLNQDGDQLDYVVRWAPMSIPVLPLTFSLDIHALRDVAGGTHGLAEIGSSFVIEASEAEDARDFNFDGQRTFDYLGTLRPSGVSAADTPWDFSHAQTFTTFFGGSWLAETPDRSRLLVAVEEASYGEAAHPGQDLNAHSPPIPGEDADLQDSVPAFPAFAGSPPLLDVPLVRVAARKDGPGIVFAHGMAFFRVDENQDTHDWNGDGIRTSSILFHADLARGFSSPMGTLNALPDRPAIEIDTRTSNPLGAAFLADERLLGVVGTDLDGDGDATDLVLSYFLF